MNALPTTSAARVGRSFSRNFQTYHANAQLQAAIATLLARRLHRLGAPGRFNSLFEFGCGTGHLTHALQQRFAFDRMTLNDLVPDAQGVAERFGAEFRPGDIRRISWPEAPELIASASTLQWMQDPAALVAKLGHQLAPGGWLALSGFGPGQYHELATLGSGAHAPGLCAAADIAAPLRGFTIHEARGRAHRLWFTSPRDVLRHLRATGVNGAAREVWTRSRLQEFCDGYRARFERDGQVSLTYHPVWVIAQKPAA